MDMISEWFETDRFGEDAACAAIKVIAVVKAVKKHTTSSKAICR